MPTLLSASTGGFATLSTGGSPPLVPGARYYLGVQNPGTSNVTAALEVVFDIFVTPLTNGVPFLNTNSGAGDATDYYLYTVSTNAVRAQFEINGPSGGHDPGGPQGPAAAHADQLHLYQRQPGNER